MLYNTLKMLIVCGRTDGLRVKLDTLYALDRLTDVEYTELCGMLPEANT